MVCRWPVEGLVGKTGVGGQILCHLGIVTDESLRFVELLRRKKENHHY